MTPLERAANAIIADYERQVQSGEFCRLENGDIKLNASAFARAVLHAIREPSGEMLGNAHDAILYSTKGEELYVARSVWGRMIDAALEEG